MNNHLLTKKCALSQAIVLVISGGTIPATFAQVEDQSSERLIEEVIVTGLRRSLQSSIAIKQDSENFLEAISSEDIGKLPDVSIAESLSRLPGIAGQRVNGRAQVISIRGMGPDFSTTLLNGRQQASAGDNRAFEFDQYPSELINSAVVYKTADAAVVGMGLSGTVDLRTIRPLEHGEKTVALSFRYEQNDLDNPNSDVDDNGWRGSVSYVDQLADDTIGIALGYAHTDTPSILQRSKAWWWDTEGEDAVGIGNSDALVLHGQEVVGLSRNQVRDGIMGVFEWEPNEKVHTIIDAYYSKFEQEETSRGSYWFSTADTGDGTIFENPIFAEWGGSKVLQSGTATNLNPILRNDFNTRDDELFAFGINNEIEHNKWVFKTDVSYSRSERSEQIAETYAGLPSPDSVGFSISQDGFPTYTPGMDYSDVNQIALGDPAPWGGWGHDGAIRFPEVEETVGSLAVSGAYDLSDSFAASVFSMVSLGIDYTERSKEKDVFDNDLFLKNDRAEVLVDSQYINSPADLSFAGFPSIISYDINAVIDNYYDVSPINDDNRWNKAWSVDEEVTTVFVKLDIDTELFGLPLVGNLGLQYVDVDQSSKGFTVEVNDGTNDTSPATREAGTSYSDLLPSLNLKLEVTERQFLRFAAGKYMARPRMDDMRASTAASVGVDLLWSGSGGNPQLEPWRADSADLGYEFYLSSFSYFSVGYFYKDLESYIYNDQAVFDFTGLPNASGIEPMSNIGTMSQPTNGNGGLVKGTELSFVLDGELVNEKLAGLGIVGSFSHTDSTITPDGPDSTTTLPGLSEKVRSLTVYYEKNGFSFRISERFRSDFRGEVPQLFATRGFTEIVEDKQVDAQLSYSAESGVLEGYTFLFQVNNLTNSPYRTRLGTQLDSGAFLPEFYEEYGRQYLLGVNYKF